MNDNKGLTMRVAAITVNNLFGVFDHSIELNAEDRITIIYGPNGFGKTFTLTLVDELLNPSCESYQAISGIPFGNLAVSFDDGRFLSLEKNDTGEAVELRFKLSSQHGLVESFVYDNEPSTLDREPEWLDTLKQSIYVRFIHTERIKPLTADSWRDFNAAMRSFAAEDSEKVVLYADIINNRFMHKDVSVTKEEGLVISTVDGRKLPPEFLSSGEQHVLYLYFELLFNIGPDSLILIDEPELSLHILWQQEFLKDLGRILALADFDILIATHSPQIIHDRWDLAVELKGPDA